MAAGFGAAPTINQPFQLGRNEIPMSPGALGRDPHTFVLATYGTVTLNGATPVTVAQAAVTASSLIIFTLKTQAGTTSPNAPNVLTITSGTGFTVGGTASDTSVYSYLVLG